MYTSIRRYEGLIPSRIEELIKRVEEGFVPIVSAGEGFVSFRFVDAGDGVIATISVCLRRCPQRKSPIWLQQVGLKRTLLSFTQVRHKLRLVKLELIKLRKI